MRPRGFYWTGNPGDQSPDAVRKAEPEVMYFSDGKWFSAGSEDYFVGDQHVAVLAGPLRLEAERELEAARVELVALKPKGHPEAYGLHTDINKANEEVHEWREASQVAGYMTPSGLRKLLVDQINDLDAAHSVVEAARRVVGDSCNTVGDRELCFALEAYDAARAK